MAKTLDLTSGPIARKLLWFALPLLGASLIQQLYTTVDILFVSNYLGAGASAAVGASVLLNSALVNLFTGISIGAGVVIAQAFGRKEEVQLSKSIHTSMMLGLIGGILLTVIGEVTGSAFLSAVNTPASIFQDALDYVQVFFLGLTFMLVFNMAAGVMRALGNSQTPMMIQLICGIIHVATNYLFIMHMENGILAVAWSSVLSQVLAAIISVYYLLKSGVMSISKLAVDGPMTREIVRIGLPAGLQGVVVTLSNVFVQYFINGFDVTAIAAFTAYYRIRTFVLHAPVCPGAGHDDLYGAERGSPALRPGEKRSAYYSDFRRGLFRSAGSHPAIFWQGNLRYLLFRSGGYRYGNQNYLDCVPVLLLLCVPGDFRGYPTGSGAVNGSHVYCAL